MARLFLMHLPQKKNGLEDQEGQGFWRAAAKHEDLLTQVFGSDTIPAPSGKELTAIAANARAGSTRLSKDDAHIDFVRSFLWSRDW